ncbi:MAG TPA: hypothetical protein VGD67_22925 [Pseudonocardiaceae bacterium]
MTSGHEAQAPPPPPWWNPIPQPWRTACDNVGTGPADPGSSWAGVLRGMVAVPWNRYFNYAHSGSGTADVLGTINYRNPCGVVSQPVRPQIGDATAVLAANRSVPGWANVAVATVGVNNTNWVDIATQLVARRNIGAVGGALGVAAPGWAIANAANCADWAFGNPLGNPAAGPGAVPPAWDGVARSGGIAAGVAQITLSLIGADPGVQVRQALYYQWGAGDPNLPAVCLAAAGRAVNSLNAWISVGVLVTRIMWAFMGGNPNRVQAVCPLVWANAANIQHRLISFGRNNWRVVPGYPHPNAAGNAGIAGCVNGTLPRVPGAGIG